MFLTEVLERATRVSDGASAAQTVLHDFVTTLIEPMLERYSLDTAKGSSVTRFAHNPDQTMFNHIVNGVFPALNFVHEVQKRGGMEDVTDHDLRLYVLAYAMHDLDKITHTNPQRYKSDGIASEHDLLADELAELGTERFLPDYTHWIGTIHWLAANTQRVHDINLNHANFQNDGPDQWERNVTYSERSRETRIQERLDSENVLRDLCTFSDLISFVVKSPEEIVVGQSDWRSNGIRALVRRNSSQRFGFTYHKLTEVRGFLTNLVHNATTRYMQTLYDDPLIPYLFFPNGVVYLNPNPVGKNAPPPAIDREEVNRAVKEEIRMACAEAVEDGTGFGFSHLGLLKYPQYFHDFLDVQSYLDLFVKKTLSESRVNVAESTQNKMREMKQAGSIPPQIDVEYALSEQVTMIGRFLLNYMRLLDENLKTTPTIKAELERRVMARIGEEDWRAAQAIPSFGGLDYRYYWIGGQYMRRKPNTMPYNDLGGSNLQDLFEAVIRDTIELAADTLEHAPQLGGQYFGELPQYLAENLSFGFENQNHSVSEFGIELKRYATAKKPRDSSLPCTICNSAYPTTKQEEASVLFQPWVYKNRLPLYNAENAGGICVICSLELMLRQILLHDKGALEQNGKRTAPHGVRMTGKKFESLSLKYFFVYPDFFFTQQTSRVATDFAREAKDMRVFEIARTLRNKDTLTSPDILGLSFFNPKLDYATDQDRMDAETEARGSMYLSNRSDSQQYPGFIFFAKKTFGKTDVDATSSWVEAAWLALAMPLVTGARVVVSEMFMPLYMASGDFKETVILDAPHQAVRYLLPDTHLRLDQLVGSRSAMMLDYGTGYNRREIIDALARLSRAIEVHIETIAKPPETRLGMFNRIARNLATDPLWVFAFLRQQVRDAELESIPPSKARHYLDIFRLFDDLHARDGGYERRKLMDVIQGCVELYAQFYVPGYKSSSITRPFDYVTETIINSDYRDSADDIKLMAEGKLMKWMDRVRERQAEGIARFWGKAIEAEEMPLIREFVRFVYHDVFEGRYDGERGLLRAARNRLRDGCEAYFTANTDRFRIKKAGVSDVTASVEEEIESTRA